MKNKISKEPMTNAADFSRSPSNRDRTPLNSSMDRKIERVEMLSRGFSLPRSSPMKAISFKGRVAEIFRLKFHGGASSAFELGMRRAEFEEKQYRLLVDLTEQATTDFAKNCRKTWQRGVERSRAVQERFKLLIDNRVAERKDYLDDEGALLNISMDKKTGKVSTLPR